MKTFFVTMRPRVVLQQMVVVRAESGEEAMNRARDRAEGYVPVGAETMDEDGVFLDEGSCEGECRCCGRLIFDEDEVESVEGLGMVCTGCYEGLLKDAQEGPGEEVPG